VKAQTLRLEALSTPLEVRIQGGVYVISGPGIRLQLVNPAVIPGVVDLAAEPSEFVARVTVDIHPVIKDALS